MGSGSPLALFSDLDRLFLTRTAERDLERLLRKNPKEFRQIAEDLRRLAKGDLPPGGRKKLSGFDLMQLDCGRFRVVYQTAGREVHIVAVFPKPDQKKRLRALKS